MGPLDSHILCIRAYLLFTRNLFVGYFWLTVVLQVMLASVATHSSRSKIAPAALLELKTACDLFEMAAGYGGRAVKFLVSLSWSEEVEVINHVFVSRS